MTAQQSVTFDCRWCRAGNGARFLGVSGLLVCQMHRSLCRPRLTWAGRIRNLLGLSLAVPVPEQEEE